MAEERLQKYLARAGVASRRHAEELITAGRVMVNNEKVTELGSRVDPEKDMVTVDGQLAEPPEKTSYYLLYKPVGVVTTLSDPQGRPTVASYLEETGKRLFPVGRLDYDAEGALLFTDDGALAHKLTHPSFQVPRTYLSKVKGAPTTATLEKLRGGVRLEDGMATPVSVEVFEAAERNTWLKIVVAEGRPHLIKRLCAAVGHPVVRLYRPSYAGVGVEGLRPGQLRPLTQAEVTLLEGVSEGRIQAPADSLKLPPRRHGRTAPGFEGEEIDEGEDDMDDEAPKKRPARKAAPEKSRGGTERGPAKRAPREERKPRTEGGTGIARFNRVRGGEEEGGRPERREWKPRAEGAERPARRGFGGEGAERPARKSFGAGAERPARRGFGGEGAERPARKSFGAGAERPARKSFGGEGAERPARKSFGAGAERPARRGFGSEGAERPARKSFGAGAERPARRGFGGEGAERPARKSFGGAGAGRPERRGFGGEEGGRPERREWKPRGESAERPARRGFGGEGAGRPERRGFGGEGAGRPERRGFGGAGAGRPERRSFGGEGADRPARRAFGGEGAGRPERRGFGGEGGGRPERREWKPRGEGAGRPERRSFGGEGGGRPERREWKPRGEGAGRPERRERGPREDTGFAPRGKSFGGAGRAERGERSPRGSAGARGARGEAGAEKPAYQDWSAKKTRGTDTQWSSRSPRGGAGRPSPRGGPRRPR